jgi:helix-turn-helix, Psq domain
MERANQAASAALLTEPPVGWLGQDETCRRLRKSPRRLNELIEKGKGPEKVLVMQEGRRPAPFYNPDDVARLEEKLAPLPVAFASDSGVGPRQVETAITGAPPVLELLERLADRAFGLIERRPPPDLGPWLSIAAAAREYGIPPSTLRHIAREKLRLQDPAVYRPVRGGLRIRRGAVASIDARELHVADQARPRRRAPEKKLLPTNAPALLAAQEAVA